jgi:hypothetical protein
VANDLVLLGAREGMESSQLFQVRPRRPSQLPSSWRS